MTIINFNLRLLVQNKPMDNVTTDEPLLKTEQLNKEENDLTQTGELEMEK